MEDVAQTLQIRLVSHDDRWVSRMENLAGSIRSADGRQVAAHRGAVEASDSSSPAEILILDLDSLGDETLREMPSLRPNMQNSWVVVSYQSPSSDRLLRAMRSGANDYLPGPASSEDLIAVIRRAGRQADEPVWEHGRVISVFGNSGGVGVTTVAIDTAAAAAAHLGQKGRVALLDLVLQRGDVAAFLDMRSDYSLSTLVTDLERVDVDYLRGALPKHAAGFYVVPAPWTPEEEDLVKALHVGRALSALREAFDVVIVDAGHQFSDVAVAALDSSDRVMLVTLPILPSVRNAKRSLELFERLRYEKEKISLLLNRYDAHGGIDTSAVEKAVGRKMDWCLPNDYDAVIHSINEGVPLRAVEPDGELAASFDEMTSWVVFGRRMQPKPMENQTDKFLRVLSDSKVAATNLYKKISRKVSHGTA